MLPTGQKDSIGSTLSYVQVYNDVKAIVETERYDLLEALADRIARRVLTAYPDQQVQKVGACICVHVCLCLCVCVRMFIRAT